MAIITPGRSRSRPPYSKKTLIQDFWRGMLRVRSWPRKRGLPKQPWQLAGMERLKVAQKAVKNLPEREVVPTREGLEEFMREHTGVKGTAAIRLRDWQTMNFFGRAYMPIRPDGRPIYSFAQMQDVSAFLDVIEPRYGSLLVRGREGWAATRQCRPRTPLVLGPGIATPGCCPPADIPPMTEAAGGYNDASFMLQEDRITYQDAVIESQPFIYFPFDETGGGQAEEIISGNLYATNDLIQGVDPLFSSSVHAIQAVTGAKKINTDLIPANGDSQRSIEFTLKYDPAGSNNQRRVILSYGNTSAAGRAFEVALNESGNAGVTGAMRISVRSGNITWTTALNDGSIYHVHIVVRGPQLSDIECYVNGVPENVSLINNQTLDTAATALDIADNNLFNQFQWRGWLDDLIIWNRALTQAEIDTLFTLWNTE